MIKEKNLMDTKDVRSVDLGNALVETKTDYKNYETTDCQVSTTGSIQSEFISGDSSVFTL